MVMVGLEYVGGDNSGTEMRTRRNEVLRWFSVPGAMRNCWWHGFAPIAQLAEAVDLKSIQCRFEPDWGHY